MRYFTVSSTRYNSETDPTVGMYKAIREGGARFAEDCISDVPNRYARDAAPIFEFPYRSFAAFTGSTLDPFDYEAGVFWKYLAEQHGLGGTEPEIGIDCHRAILECSATLDAAGGPLPTPPAGTPYGYDPRVLRTARARLPWYGRLTSSHTLTRHALNCPHTKRPGAITCLRTYSTRRPTRARMRASPIARTMHPSPTVPRLQPATRPCCPGTMSRWPLAPASPSRLRHSNCPGASATTEFAPIRHHRRAWSASRYRRPA